MKSIKIDLNRGAADTNGRITNCNIGVGGGDETAMLNRPSPKK